LRLAFSSVFFFFSNSFCRFSYWKFVFAMCHLCDFDVKTERRLPL
jgi:hypothetical protein